MCCEDIFVLLPTDMHCCLVPPLLRDRPEPFKVHHMSPDARAGGRGKAS